MNAEPQRARLNPAIRLRPMTQGDVPEVLAVEHASYPFPWSEGVFRDCVRVGYVCRVVEFEGEISGYAIMSHGAGEAHVLNICMARELRGVGVGRRVMEYLLQQARDAQVQDVFLEVRPSNPPAIRLYESLGFERVGVRKGYYQAIGGREDAWVYKKAL